MAKKILLVEDEEDFATALTAVLHGRGYDISWAKDGEEGLRIARQMAPDLIILDVMLPKMDGYKVCRLLKFDERYKHIPIIMLTARAEDTDIEIGQKTGANDYVIKTIKPATFLEKIKNYIGE